MASLSAAVNWIDSAPLVLAVVAFASASAGSCTADDSVNDSVFLIHRAVLLDGTEDWKATARRRLGCDPCEVFVAPDNAEFLFGQGDPMKLERDDIESAQIVPSVRYGRRVFVLHLKLSDSGKERLRSYIARYPMTSTINEFRGRLLGVTALALNDDLYVAGQLPNEEAAKEIASSIGIPFRMEAPIPGRVDKEI